MKEKYFCLLAMIVSVFIAPHSVKAAVVPKMTWERLVNETSYVFSGTVLDMTFIEDDNDPKMRVTFSIDDEFMGSYGEEKITIDIQGGNYPDNEFYWIPGAPQYMEGNSYLVFIKEGNWYLTPSTNWWHSSLRKITVSNSEFLIDDNSGSCVISVSEEKSFVFGPRIVNKIELFFGFKVMKPELSSTQIKNNLSHCLPYENIVSQVRGLLPAYSPYTPNISLQSSLIDGELPEASPIYSIPEWEPETVTYPEEGDPMIDELYHPEDD